MYETHTQNLQKVNVWDEILNNDYFFIESNSTTENYLAMLRDKIIPTIQNIARLKL